MIVEHADMCPSSLTDPYRVVSVDGANITLNKSVAANKANGNAMANEKPSIPIIGPIYPPEAASTNKVPTIGPVQEKETSAKVKAIKKIPNKPPLPSASTLLLVHDAGN